MNFSKIGFVLAALGSSIGLGHIWRFPYMAGENGGGAFVVLYLILALSIGVAMLVVEMLIGHTARKNAIDCYPALMAKNSHTKENLRFGWFGFTVIGGPFILSFYAIILGWIFYYLGLGFSAYPSSTQEAKEMFEDLAVHSFWIQSVCFSAMLAFTAFVVAKGIKDGIERCNVVFMPLLFVIFIGLLVYACTMSGFAQSAEFLFSFDITKITPRVFIEAMGQVFFSLSLGVGTMVTYAIYTQEKQNLLKSSLWIVFSGIVISLIAGLMIFAFLYEFDEKPSQGAGLILKALPLAFGKMNAEIAQGVGQVVGALFFIAVIFAGITSTISILEPCVAVVKEKFNISQNKSTWLVSLCIWAFGEVIILSSQPSLAKSFSMFGKSLFDTVAFVSSDFIMPIGGILAIVFVGYCLKKEFLAKASEHFFNKWQFSVWFFIVRFVAPIVIIAILVWEIASQIPASD